MQIAMAELDRLGCDLDADIVDRRPRRGRGAGGTLRPAPALPDAGFDSDEARSGEFASLPISLPIRRWRRARLGTGCSAQRGQEPPPR
jgi:hypothetical protein